MNCVSSLILVPVFDFILLLLLFSFCVINRRVKSAVFLCAWMVTSERRRGFNVLCEKYLKYEKILR